jgi:hypothetical protein
MLKVSRKEEKDALFIASANQHTNDATMNF